jgi:hypothetical protein
MKLVFVTFMKFGDGEGRHVRHGQVDCAAHNSNMKKRNARKGSGTKGGGIKVEIAEQISVYNTAVARTDVCSTW